MFRDRAALTFMLLAPFLLTIGMGFVTGRFSGGSTGISDIPVVIVNLGPGSTGQRISGLVQLSGPCGSDGTYLLIRPATARQMIENNQASAAIIIPEGFTRSIIPLKEQPSTRIMYSRKPCKLKYTATRTRPTSAGIIKSVVDEFVIAR